MITLAQYVGVYDKSPDWNVERQANAVKLLVSVNNFMHYLGNQGIDFPVNPATNSQVSGQTLGGFRPQNCTQGAPKSSHKEGLAVDVYDPINAIDNYIMQNQDKLVEYGIYIEAPSSTRSWSHWSIKAPGSGRHVFNP